MIKQIKEILATLQSIDKTLKRIEDKKKPVVISDKDIKVALEKSTASLGSTIIH